MSEMPDSVPVNLPNRKSVIVAAGAGRMGRGIAITFALAGFRVKLLDLKPRDNDAFEALRTAANGEIRNTLSMLAGLGVLPSAGVDAAVSRVSVHAFGDSEGILARADVIFEGVPETLAAKEFALRLLSSQCRSDAIVASTTSTILATELQSFVESPGRFLNAHWLNPAFLVPLVELSPGSQTLPAVTTRLKSLLESIGKVPVVCTASPGYIVPRIQALAMNEAARLAEEAVASVEDIDKATRFGFGFRFAVLGLLEFIDWGGGDILYHASRYMVEATGDTRFSSPGIIESNMQAGRTGLRSRKGFLDYSDLDVDAYQRERLAAFVAMLQHIGKLPVTEEVVKPVDPVATVRDYLSAMQSRELERAKTYLAPDFTMTFPGNHTFSTLEALGDWARERYRSVGKTFERFDVCNNAGEVIVYCHGTLHGVWLDGSTFEGIRFIDRFVLADGLISSQLVWNDMSVSAAENA